MSRRAAVLLLVLLLVGLSLLYLAPALDGDAFVSMDVVWRHTLPWSDAADRPAGPEHNPYLSDHATIYYPWLLHTRAALRAGTWPLWSEESYAGVPFFGNLSVALLSPFTWLFTMLPWAPSFALVAALKWLLAGLLTFWLARTLGLSGVAAVLPAVAYAFAGFQVVWINSALTHVSVLLPGALAAAERALQRPTGRRLGLLAVLLFALLVGGHPETSFYCVATLGLFCLGRLTAAPEGTGRTALRLLAAAGLALLLSTVQLAPFLEYALSSEGFRVRREASYDLFRATVAPWSLTGLLLIGLFVALARWLRGLLGSRPAWIRAAGWALLLVGAGLLLRVLGARPTALLLLLPDLYARPIDGGVYAGPLTYTDVAAGFAGGLTLLLAIVAVVRGRGSTVRLLAGIAVLLAARLYRLPLLCQLLEGLPVVGTTGPTRSLGALALVVALLAGFGLRALREAPWAAWRPILASLALGLGLALPAEFWTAPEIPEATGPRLDVVWQTLRAPVPDPGVRIEGQAPAGAPVELSVNGVDVGPAAWDGASFRFLWIGAGRLDEGRYRVEARQEGDGVAAGVVDLRRPFVPSSRLLLLPVLLLALWAVARWCPAGIPALVLGGVVLELAMFGARYNDFTPTDRLPGPVAPLDQLQERLREDGPFRVLGMGTALQPNLHYVPGIPILRGYDALEPVRYVALLRLLYENGREVPWILQDFSTMTLEHPLADVLALRYALGAPQIPDPGWVECWRQGGVALYENQDVLPLAFTVQEVRVWRPELGPPPDVDLRECVVIERGTPQVFAGEAVVEDLVTGSGRVAVRVRSDAGTFLVVSQNALPGWQVRTDGARAPLVPAYGVLLGVEVPAGSHQVEFRYRPGSVRWGAAASALGAVLLALLLLWRRPGGPATRAG